MGKDDGCFRASIEADSTAGVMHLVRKGASAYVGTAPPSGAAVRRIDFSGSARVILRDTDQPSIFINVINSQPSCKEFSRSLLMWLQEAVEQWGWLQVELQRYRPRYVVTVRIHPSTETDCIVHFNIVSPSSSVLKLFVVPLRNAFRPGRAELHGDLLRRIVEQISDAVLACELALGQRLSWKSDNSQQCAMWAYCLWLKVTKADNLKARLLSERAVSLDHYNVRARALQALTYVDAISYKWDDDITDSRRRMTQCANLAFAFGKDSKDSYARTAFACACMVNNEIPEAIRHFELAATLDELFPYARYQMGLVRSHMGDFDFVERHLEIELASLGYSNHPLQARYLQYLSQVKCFLGKYDEGIVMAEHALRLNPVNSPALRTLSANLAANGRFREARERFREGSRYSGVFSTAAYREQPWQTAARSALAKYADFIVDAGAERG